jgi:amidohydrolase
VRTYDRAVLDRTLTRMEEILRGITVAFGATHQLDHSTLGACVNDAGCAALVEGVAAKFLGAENVAETRVTGADDMCRFLEERPGAYFMLGAAKANADGHVYPHHHPKFDFDEACIPLGIELAVRIIEEASGSRIA